MTRPLSTYSVAPRLPKEIETLRELSYNLSWTWDHEIVELFMRLDPELWEATDHNPLLMIGRIRQEALNAAARDDAFLAHLDRALGRTREYMKNPSTWFQKAHDGTKRHSIAYFSAEFGLTECMAIYSGGLGLLAGDHLRSASDLGVPLIGIGLLYQEGYFRQYLNLDGWQQERYPENDFYTLPLQLMRTTEGKPVTVAVDFPGRSVFAQVWLVQVGRVPLYLLDTNIPGNTPADQNITDQLYGGDREVRIMQEILLGIGGCRALHALGLEPVVCHMNEGHSAFLALERCRRLISEQGLSFAEAREATMAGTVFTTHTPVPSGNDYFAPALMEKFFNRFAHQLGLPFRDFLALGRQNPDDQTEEFCMTILALRMAGHSNGVSKLHGLISRRMWQAVWPGISLDEVPITSITNGVHAPTWVSRDMSGLLTRYLGPRWREDPADQELSRRINQIPDEELWRTHERRRERLVAFARHRLRSQLESVGATPAQVAQSDEILDPEALTIGFARRFATYKRATLLLRNPERLLRILNNPNRPVQLIFAGKAHPHDTAGKEFIRQIIHFARRDEVRHRMVFLEDYDITVGRYLVQGVDVWLNTPRRPLEASGTSGMKAALNGVLNISILDGWWDEAYTPEAGWAIGCGEEYGNEAHQDEVESNALYDLIEKEVVPLFFNRAANGLPRAWVDKMKASMRILGPQFNAKRMVREYTEEVYLPSQERYMLLAADGFRRSRGLASWKERLRNHWAGLKILEVRGEFRDDLKVGDPVTVRAAVRLGQLTPDDIAVELYHGLLDARGDFVQPNIVRMTPSGTATKDGMEFVGTMEPSTSGRHGYTVRLLPKNPDLIDPRKVGLILWA
ncbi:MAG: alpha-glucan phosphorylase [Acidobacteria bacterium]|nr:alpha-glucan phosphorylase [Acidobacteriota bacterium]